MDNSIQASIWMDKIMECKSIANLEAMGQEIKIALDNDSDFSTEFRQWLRDIYFSKLNYDLKLPDVPLEEMLNARGRAALRKGLI